MIKRYKCQFPKCDKEIQIRTKIKNPDSEYFGLNVCSYHANLEKAPKVKSDQTRRTEKARVEQRKDYPEFFKKHIEIARGRRCLECGKALSGNSTEIAHIIMKSRNPELAILDENILYLCGDMCHHKFDSSMEKRKEMKCFDLSVERYKLLKPLLLKNTSETLFYDNFI